MFENEKARKLKKRKKGSKKPLYVLLIAVIVIFSLLGIGLYHSLGTVNPQLLLMVLVILGATILIELILKRDYYLGRTGKKDEEEAQNKPKDEP